MNLENLSDISFDDTINHINDESIATLAELLSIPKSNISIQRETIKNIISSKINLDEPQIKNDFLDIIHNLYLIEHQIIPQTMINLNFLKRSFYLVQITDQLPKDYFIQLSDQNINNETIYYLQLIPDGLPISPDFIILENDRTIESNYLNTNSYIKLTYNGSDKIKLTFINSPQSFYFFQILQYQRKSNDELFQYLRSKLNIPKEISDFEARVCHIDHSFELIQLINSIQKNNSIICPICNEKAELLFFDGETNEHILDYILDDKDADLINSLTNCKGDHVFISKFRIPNILQNFPSFLSLCCFFNSKKCFFSLLNFYLEKNENFRINQKDQFNRSPIHFACFGGDLSIVKALIENNEKFEFKDKNGLRPIHYAAIGGQFKIIEYFYSNEHDMFPVDNIDSKTPFHLACQYGFLNIVKFYCQIVIPCTEKVRDFKGFLSHFCPNKITPLHDACIGGKVEVVDYFLNLNDFYNEQIRMNSNVTPLLCACESGNLDCVKALLDSGFVFDEQQIMESFCSAVLGGHLDVLSFMVKKSKIKISFIMILASIANNNLDVAKFLIQNAFSDNEAIRSLLDNLNNTTNVEFGNDLQYSPDLPDAESLKEEDQNVENNNFERNQNGESINYEYQNDQNVNLENRNVENINSVNVNERNRNEGNGSNSNLLPTPVISNSIRNGVPNPALSVRNYENRMVQNNQQQQNFNLNQLIQNQQRNPIRNQQQNSIPNLIIRNNRQQQLNFIPNPMIQNQMNQNTQLNPIQNPIIQNQMNQNPIQNPIIQNQMNQNPIQNQQQNPVQNQMNQNQQLNPIQNQQQNPVQMNQNPIQNQQQNPVQNQMNQNQQLNPIQNQQQNPVQMNQNQQLNPIPNPTSQNNQQQHNLIPHPIIINTPNRQNIQRGADPSVIGYDKDQPADAPLTFADLSQLSFPNKTKVKIAVQNISMIQKRAVHIIKSEQRRIIFKCIKECSFTMTWKEKDGHWISIPDCFTDHSCTLENAKIPKFHYNVIDSAIKCLPIANLDMKAKVKVLSDFFGGNADKRTIRKRLKK